jgi:prophage DNA circulation protein
VATTAEASATVDFASHQEAAAVREALAVALEAEAETADDAVYQALMDLRAAVVADITARGANLARIVTLRQPGTLPALVVAHRLYGDAARAEEIVARNALRHPGFVPGGRDLQVLTA